MSSPTEQPSTSSSTCLLNTDDEVSFRYKWPLKLRKRLLQNGEKTVLHVSPAFCTAYNGVQFHWLVRICDEFVLDMDVDGENEDRRLINIILYYKDGPAQEIQLTEAKFSIKDADDRRQFFSTVAREGLDYIKGSGSGWSHSDELADERTQLSSFIQENIGKNITVIVELKIKMRWFFPLVYLPDIDSQDNKLQVECEQVLDEMLNGKLPVPDVELFDATTDRYAFHRHCFVFACKEISKKLPLVDEAQQVENVFANIYFNRVINEEAECFEDFVEFLCESFVAPALKRECERHICRELMLETTDYEFVKKMLLLAEKFHLKVLKMVAFGIIVDRFIDSNHTMHGSVTDIRDELLAIAEQIKTTDDEDQEQHEENGLVESVIDQLEELAKHIRKVSMSPDSGCPLGIAPVSSPSPLSQQGRRSSLKTSRELLFFSSSSALGPSFGSSPRMESRRRRSVMFSLPNTLDESAVAQFKSESQTGTSSTNSLSSRVLPDVDELSLDTNPVAQDDFGVDDKPPSIFSFEEPYVRCERAS